MTEVLSGGDTIMLGLLCASCLVLRALLSSAMRSRASLSLLFTLLNFTFYTTQITSLNYLMRSHLIVSAAEFDTNHNCQLAT